LNQTCNWRRYLGLPHIFGADPNDGIGADCVIMTWNVLAGAGQYTPPLDPAWFTQAEAGAWDELTAVYKSVTYELPVAEEYAVTLFNNGPIGVGLGVVVDGGLLMVHHKRGVCWAPTRLLKRLTYCRFRDGDAAV
jgi:hypothetical protein